MIDAQNVTVRLSSDMLADLDRIAKAHPGNNVRRVTRPEIMREALVRMIADDAQRPEPQAARPRSRTASAHP